MPQKTLLLTRRFSWPFLLSAGLHSSVIAALLYASFNQSVQLPQSIRPISMVMINPAEFEAAPAAKPAAEEPPKAEPEPEPAEPEAPPPEPEPVPEPEPTPEPVSQPVAIPLPEPKPKPKPRPEPKKRVEKPKPVKREARPERQKPAPFTSDAPARSANNAPTRQAPTASSSMPSSGPRPLSRAEPQYPARAFALRIEGRVQIQFDVDDSGRVGNVRVLSAQPRNMFERDIRQVMRKWRYESGKPGKDLVVTFIFRINGGAVVE